MPSPNNPLSPDSLPLRDIRLPDPISWWPLPPGWWLLFGLTMILAAGIWWLHRRHRRARFRRFALQELDALASRSTTSQEVALSRLLRRAALCYFPPEECAGLCGEEWLDFLDRPFPDRPFSQGIGRILLDAPYRPVAESDSRELINLCRRWLQKLPVHGQKRRREG